MPTTEEQSTNNSLLHCTLKKSGQVLKKVVLYASYAIVALAVVAVICYGAIAVYHAIVPWAASIWQFLIAVPWYMYAIIVVIAAIPVYSVLWCIARDLTEVDWKSNAANVFAFAAFAFAVAFAFALALPAFALALPAALFAALFVLDPVDHITIWYYIFRFPGAAWHHYRRK